MSISLQDQHSPWGGRMKDHDRTKEELVRELDLLRRRLAESETTQPERNETEEHLRRVVQRG